MTIKAIETNYDGYKFRSRLEARWGVFFKNLGIEYLYENEGYELPSGWYLPDFYLPELDLFVEVKGQEPIERERNLISELVTLTNKRATFVHQVPNIDNFQGLEVYFSLEGEDGTNFCGWDDNYKFCECEVCGAIGFEFYGMIERAAHKKRCYMKKINNSFSSNTISVANAYSKARQARFEHGEKGG